MASLSSSPSSDSPNTHMLPPFEVRFDEECILIPHHISRAPRLPLPKFVSRSYSLPLWRRRTGSQSDSSDADTHNGSPPDEPDHFSFTVPIPRLSKRSPSPSPGGRRSSSVDDRLPLSPCLVHRDPTSPHPPPSRTRRPSFPALARHDSVTIPLRPCCPNCVDITERCLAEGDSWTEKFTRAARKRRSASIDACSERQTKEYHVPLVTKPLSLPDESAVVDEDTEEVVDGPTGFRAVTVDEVDKIKGTNADEELLSGPKSSGDSGTAEESVTPPHEEEILTPKNEPMELVIPPTISRRRVALSPIPSLNPSVDDLVHQVQSNIPAFTSSSLSANAPSDEESRASPVDKICPSPSLPALSSSPSTPPTSFNSPQTPLKSTTSPRSPDASPPVFSPGTPGTPSGKLHIQFPSRRSFMRAGSELFKGVTAFGSGDTVGVGMR